MKKIKYYMVAISLTVAFSACQDWLTIYPNNEQTHDQFWRSGEEAAAVLTSAYAVMSYTNDIQERLFVWGESRGNGVINLVAAESIDLSTGYIYPDNKFTKWSYFYEVINIANSMIKYAPDVVLKDNSYKEEIMRSQLSEAYFLRSLCMFYLVRTFRDVPFPTEPYVTDDYTFNLEKSSDTVILNQLLVDLYYCQEFAKDYFQENDESDPQRYRSKGRATKSAVWALIADIELWIGNYDNCIAACEEIERMGQVGLIQAVEPWLESKESDKLDKWYSNFIPGGSSNESIFELQHTTTNGNKMLYDWFVNGKAFGASNYTVSLFGTGTFYSTNPDVRKYSINATGISYYIGKYLYTNSKGAVRATSGTVGNNINWIIYRYADILLMKAEALVMRSEYNEVDYKAAVDIINQIRDRANATPISITDSQKDMLRLILSERQREFIGEGKNWFDIIRVGKHNDYKHKDLVAEEVGKRDMTGSGGMSAISAKLSNVDYWYMPINFDELKVNKLLKQNPYYTTFN